MGSLQTYKYGLEVSYFQQKKVQVALAVLRGTLTHCQALSTLVDLPKLLLLPVAAVVPTNVSIVKVVSRHTSSMQGPFVHPTNNATPHTGNRRVAQTFRRVLDKFFDALDQLRPGSEQASLFHSVHHDPSDSSKQRLILRQSLRSRHQVSQSRVPYWSWHLLQLWSA